MITVQVEHFADCRQELADIFPLHWEELGKFKDRMPLMPQYGEYVHRNILGKLILVTARIDGRIMGYYTAQIAPGFHYASTLTATMDLCYIHPSVRNRGLAAPLFRAVEKELKRRGVQLWFSGYKHHNQLGMPALLNLLGFQMSDCYESKWIGNDHVE